MSTDQVRHFVAVARTGSVSAAARDPEAHATFCLCAREDQTGGGGLAASVMELVGRL